MNYQHNFHAGNFADVIKHLVLIDILLKLREKPEPFFVIDTHAGQGLYDLQSTAALRTGEAQHGILNLQHHGADHPLLQQYFNIIAANNRGLNGSRFYPGSPLIAQTLIRDQDQLYVNELHPASHETLQYFMKADPRVKVTQVDGYSLLNSSIPKISRGLVLIDPPFEKKDEFDRVIDSLQESTHRFSQQICMIWYPIKDEGITKKLATRVKDFFVGQMLNIQFYKDNVVTTSPLSAAGILILNPPKLLEITTKEVLDIITPRLGSSTACHYIIDKENQTDFNKQLTVLL